MYSKGNRGTIPQYIPLLFITSPCPHSVRKHSAHSKRVIRLTSLSQGALKWYSRLYRNQGSLLFGPGPLDWGEQIVVVTGGTYSAQHRNDDFV